mmetsp:Transcript_6110/g.9375  ORF Transcript_6110/g.9375 Transcript_6110/m.9375 type:complete len:1345 (-) Transcript_6110:261-4295(-)
MLEWILLCLVVHSFSLRPSNRVWSPRKFTFRTRSDYAFPRSVRLFLAEASDRAEEDLIDNEKRTKQENRNYISSEQLAALKESVDIISALESYNLKGFTRKGENSASAVCPFHEDHNPSLSISGDRKLFKCFACGEGGDIFKFVRSYSALKGEDVTFYESVKIVAKKFGDPSIGIDTNSYKSNFRETDAVIQHKKRLQLCNMAAADFFAKALIHLPAGGASRTHLRNRGLSPSTVRGFALGYAPDSYFQTGKPWGKGSLVEHLQSVGFSGREIEDAGLATRSKKPSWNDVGSSGKNCTENEKNDAEGLMDRFRGRIMVPIFDEKGDKIVGFGGRVVGSSTDALSETKFRAPKYLNTKETLIFSKKKELFGLPNARKAIADSKTRGSKPMIIIVEGYMDAIALWEAGLRDTVASMGTAITTEQLRKAAKATGPGGRIVLCLDNDKAGRIATERLCSTLVLAKTCEMHSVELVVAELPDGIKDPAEYFESKKRKKDKFRVEVLDKALEWSQWYIQRILSGYDASAVHGASGSFAGICESVSDFVATFSLPADRTRRAFEVAKHLSNIIAGSSSKSSSQTLQVQLESDLLSMVSRKAAAKEIVERRVEAVDGFSSKNKTIVLDRLLSGGLSPTGTEIDKLAKNATKSGVKHDRNRAPTGRTEKRTKASSSFSPRQLRSKTKKRLSKQAPLTPHFTGIDVNHADADWLNVPREKWKRKMKDLTFGSVKDNYQKAVFFNSNLYHGDQYLTDEAKQAGYSKGIVKKDRAMLEKGIGVFLLEDPEHKAMVAEERLLRVLVQHVSARNVMSDIVSTGYATGARPQIDWSCDERSWLFNFLVFKNHEIPTDIKEENLEKLWNFLSQREDAPRSAFIKSPSHEVDLSSALPIPKENGIDRRHAFDETVINKSTIDDGDNDVQYPPISNDTGDMDEKAFESYDPSMYDVDIQRDESILDLDTSESPKDHGVGTDAVIDVKIQAESSRATERSKSQHTCRGTLDMFFQPVEDIFTATRDESVSLSHVAQLQAQEALAHLLRANAAKKVNHVSENWLLASNLLDARLGVEGGGSDVMSGINELDNMNVGDLQLYCKSLVTRLQQLSQSVQQLDASASQISLRLMEYTQGDSVEGKIPLAKQEKLCDMVDDFVNNLPEDYGPKEIKGFVHPTRVSARFDDNDTSSIKPPSIQEEFDQGLEDVKFEDDMRIMEDFWGDMDSDEYIWTMPEENSMQGRAMPLATDTQLEEDYSLSEQREPVEEAMARIEEEWGEWEDFEPDARSHLSFGQHTETGFPVVEMVNGELSNQGNGDFGSDETENILVEEHAEISTGNDLVDGAFRKEVHSDDGDNETPLTEWE